MTGPEDFLIRFGRAVAVEMAILDREHQTDDLTPHGRDMRDALHRIADRVAKPQPDTAPLYPWHDHHPSEGRPTGWHRHPDAHGWGDILHCHEPDDSYITIRRPDAVGAPRSGWTS